MAVPRGIRNNNPLNIRKGNKWKGERNVQTDPSFEQFESVEYGLRAAFVLFQNYIEGFHGTRPKCDTITTLIAKWAPPIENATFHYIQAVSAYTGIPSMKILDFRNKKDMCAIARAMAHVECGQWLDEELFSSAYDLV